MSFIDDLRAPRGNRPPPWYVAWVRHIRPGSFLVYFLPLLLGMPLPGEKINDPNGWLVGFWRIPFVVLIVLAQAVSFVAGWYLSVGPTFKATVARRVLATVYIVLISFWLGRNYFFGVEVDWQTCARLFAFCFLPTLIMDAIASRQRQQQRND